MPAFSAPSSVLTVRALPRAGKGPAHRLRTKWNTGPVPGSRDLLERRFASSLAFAVLVAGSAAGEAAADRAERSPLDALRPGMASELNLLVVTLDTTRADRIGSYGYAA